MCLGAQYLRLNHALNLNPNLSQVCGLRAAWGAQLQKGQRLLAGWVGVSGLWDQDIGCRD